MRRKNMLALGMSLVFCATATAVPLYANPLDRQERTVSEEKETSENQAENSVVDIAILSGSEIVQCINCPDSS